MQIVIINKQTSRLTEYKSEQLKRDALHAVKGKGKLENYWVEFVEGEKATLVAQYASDYKPAEWTSSVRIAL